MSRATKIADPSLHAADHATHADGGRESLIVQKSVDELLRAAHASGHLNMSARIPALTACPEELFDLLADNEPPSFSHDELSPEASTTHAGSRLL